MAAVTLNSDVRQHKRRPRINKHLTERRRRARINDSLFQLKSLVFPALENKVSKNSNKVEKADILEMTLLYLRGLQQQISLPHSHQTTTDPFQAGFSECLGNVSQFLSSCDVIDPNTRTQLLDQLATRCTKMAQSPAAASLTPPPSPTIPTCYQSRASPAAVSPASSPYGHLTVDVKPTTVPSAFHQNCNGNRFALVTPPQSPVVEEMKPVVRNSFNNSYYHPVTSAYGKDIVSAKMTTPTPVWRPW